MITTTDNLNDPLDNDYDGMGSQLSSLRQENASLKSELREARELIRNLELQVESQRANARKAAQALLDAA